MQKIRKDADDGQAEDEYDRPGWDAVMFEIQEVRETQRNLEKFLQTMQSQHQQDHTVMLQTLEEERSRYFPLSPNAPRCPPHPVFLSTLLVLQVGRRRAGTG